MLILHRKLNESIVIDGRIVIKVLRIKKDSVKIGVAAPLEIPVHREEKLERADGPPCGALAPPAA